MIWQQKQKISTFLCLQDCDKSEDYVAGVHSGSNDNIIWLLLLYDTFISIYILYVLHKLICKPCCRGHTILYQTSKQYMNELLWFHSVEIDTLWRSRLHVALVGYITSCPLQICLFSAQIWRLSCLSATQALCWSELWPTWGRWLCDAPRRCRHWRFRFVSPSRLPHRVGERVTWRDTLCFSCIRWWAAVSTTSSSSAPVVIRLLIKLRWKDDVSAV